MKVVKGGVTKPKGYKSSGLACGIKRSSKLDLALIYSETLANAAGVYTKNTIKAAPLVVTEKHLKNCKAQAIVVNSGNANCFTGSFGHIYANRTAELFGKLLNLDKTDVLVASTGIIGKPLPFKKIQKAAKKLVGGLSKSASAATAKAILTTDTVKKEIAVTLTLGGKQATIGACAKGSGMIEPNMATMLAFINTDAAISKSMLKKALKEAVADSFNCITVDGCMSTNDMVTVFANGHAKNKPITKAGKDFKKFCDALNYVCLDLAKKIVRDGEGATKFLEITTQGASTKKEAHTVSLKIADSALVKTAAFGNNPNWGRVAAAVGAAGVKTTERSLKIKFSSFKKKDIKISVDLGLGKHEATVYTTDLSHDYVKINAEYN